MQANRNLISEILQRRRLSDFLVDTLLHFGTEHVFGMPAESLNPIIDAIRRNGRVKLVTVRHEGNGALMASAYAKLADRLGVCMGTAGPGASHLPIGTYDALSDEAPLLAISGQVPLGEVGSCAFQEIDPMALFRDSTGLRRLVVTPQQASLIPMICADCILARRPGLLIVPADVLTMPIDSDRKTKLNPRWLRPSPVSSPSIYTQIVDHLQHPTGRTVILIGSVSGDVRPAVEKLADYLRAPIVVVPAGIHYSTRDATHLTVEVVEQNRSAVQKSLRKAHKVVIVGSVGASVRALIDPAALIIHIAPARDAVRPPYPGAIRVSGPLVASLERITAALVASPLSTIPSPVVTNLFSTPLSAEETSLWRTLDAVLPADAVLALEPGRVLESAFRHLPIGRRTVTSSFELAIRGYALPAAIGACFALPGRQCLAIGTGDGFAQSMAELLTAKKYELPIIAICIQESSEQRPAIDFIQFAHASRVPAVQSKNTDTLGETFQIALRSGSTTLIEVLEVFGQKAQDARPYTVSTKEHRSVDSKRTFGTWFVDCLARSGVDRIYGRVGPCLTEFLHAVVQDNRLQFFDVQDPESASMMASANSKWTGGLAACVAAEGSDLPRLLNGLYDAAFDHASVLVITAAKSTSAVENVDPTVLLEDLATLSVQISPDTSASLKIAHAVAQALDGPSVVHLIVDWSSMLDPMPLDPVLFSLRHQCEGLAPDEPELSAAADQLLQAQNPVILVGRGASEARSELETLSNLLQAPILITMPGRAVFPMGHPNVVGGIGSSGHRTAIDTLERCDILLVVGSSNRGAVFGLEGTFSVVQIDNNPLQFESSNRKILGLYGTAQETVRGLVCKVEAYQQVHGDRSNIKDAGISWLTNITRGVEWSGQFSSYPQVAIERLNDGWAKRILQGLVDSPTGDALRCLFARLTGENRAPLMKRQRERFESWIDSNSRRFHSTTDPPISPPSVPSLVQEILDARGGLPAVITVDVGLVTLWVYRHFVPSNHEIIWTSSFATMGFALPAAMAIKERAPERSVIAFAGDGGIAITMAELATAVARRIPLIVIIMNNGKLGAVKFEQEVMGWPEFGPSLYNCDFAKYGDACGARGFRVHTLADLRNAFSEALDADRPCVLDVVCDSDYLPAPPKIHIRQSGGYFLALLRETRWPWGGVRGISN
jgi:thiamine pyrophosphate-dependent acetolactate synthase large subunit-like protein